MKTAIIARSLLPVTVVMLAATPAIGDTLINSYPSTSTSNISVTVSSIEPNTSVNGGDRTVIQANNGFNPVTGEHSNGTQQSWRSNNGETIGDQWIQWDLGDSYQLGSIQVWNYNDSSRYAAGIRKVDIYVSNVENPGDPEDAGAANWTLWAEDAILTPGTGTGGYTGFDLETIVGASLPATEIRYVRFEVDSTFRSDEINLGGGLLDGVNVSGLAQIEFYEAAVTATVDPQISSISISGNTATITISGDDTVGYWCASSLDLSGWTTEETILQTGTAISIPSPFNTSGGTLSFDVDVTGDSKLFFRIQDNDPSP